MNCTTCRDHFSDYLDGAIEASLRQTFASHVSKCTPCKKELTELKAAIAAVEKLEPETPSAGLPDRVLARIAREPASLTSVASGSDERRVAP